MPNIATEKMHRLRDALMQVNQLADSNGRAIAAETEADMTAMLQRFEPFAETLFLTMLSDGAADEDELLALHGALHILSNGSLHQQMIEAMLRRFALNVQQQGVEYRLQVIGAHLCRDQADREIAFKLAATVALANNKIEDAEERFLVTMAEYFGISAKRSQVLLGDI